MNYIIFKDQWPKYILHKNSSTTIIFGIFFILFFIFSISILIKKLKESSFQLGSNHTKKKKLLKTEINYYKMNNKYIVFCNCVNNAIYTEKDIRFRVSYN